MTDKKEAKLPLELTTAALVDNSVLYGHPDVVDGKILLTICTNNGYRALFSENITLFKDFKVGVDFEFSIYGSSFDTHRFTSNPAAHLLDPAKKDDLSYPKGIFEIMRVWFLKAESADLFFCSIAQSNQFFVSETHSLKPYGERSIADTLKMLKKTMPKFAELVDKYRIVSS